MGGEYCTCPNAPCPICHTIACSCGCGFSVGSLPFIRLHVESEEEQDRRVAIEEYNAEQAEIERLHLEEEREDHDPRHCFCTEHW